MYTLDKLIEDGIQIDFNTDDESVKKLIEKQIALNCSINPELYAELLNGNDLLINIRQSNLVEDQIVELFASKDDEKKYFSGFYLANGDINVRSELARAAVYVNNELLSALPVRKEKNFGKYEPSHFGILDFEIRNEREEMLKIKAKTKVYFTRKVTGKYEDDSECWRQEVYQKITNKDPFIDILKSLNEVKHYYKKMLNYGLYSDNESEEKLVSATETINNMINMILKGFKRTYYEEDTEKDTEKFPINVKKINPRDFNKIYYSTDAIIQEAVTNLGFLDRLYTNGLGEYLTTNMEFTFIK